MRVLIEPSNGFIDTNDQRIGKLAGNACAALTNSAKRIKYKWPLVLRDDLGNSLKAIDSMRRVGTLEGFLQVPANDFFQLLMNAALVAGDRARAIAI